MATKAMTSTGLNDRQEAFCREYVKDLNGQKAAERAGYAPAGARNRAWELLKLPAVQRQIGIIQREQAEVANITQERVLAEIARVGFANLSDFILLDDDGNPQIHLEGLTRAQTAALQEVVTESEVIRGRSKTTTIRVKTKIKMHDKLSALEKLAKHLGLYSEDAPAAGNTININGGVNLNVDLTTVELQQRLAAILTGGEAAGD